jgi:hypothetical protein
MKHHLQRWGAAYLILALFLGSWVGQFFTQLAQVADEQQALGRPFEWTGFLNEFFAATLENWQSEWLQLFVQAVVLLAMKHWIFKADAEDMERLEAKVDRLLRDAGVDPRVLEQKAARQ